MASTYISDFGLPSELSTHTKNPHCLNVTWKKACGSVTGYRIYCFSGEHQEAEIVKDIYDGQKQSAIISGLRPDKKYTVGIMSVSSLNKSKLVVAVDQPTMRNSLKYHNVLWVDILFAM